MRVRSDLVASLPFGREKRGERKEKRAGIAERTLARSLVPPLSSLLSLSLCLVLPVLQPAAAQSTWVSSETGILTTSPASSSVGIGTGAPVSALDVSGRPVVVRKINVPRGVLSANERLRLTGATSDYIFAVQDGTGRVLQYWNASSGSAPTYLVDGEAAGKILFSPQFSSLFTVSYAPPGVAGAPVVWEEYFRIKNDGSVGIGVVNPGSYKLNVAGGIRADEVVVNTTGADFVFEDGYLLRPLEDVARFIEAHSHLPGIPPSAEMAATGMGVSAMQTLLLQKVEELTRYLIEQQAQIRALEARCPLPGPDDAEEE